ncbi:hypothetical protein BVRB_024280, partial [Beta vulgaris subsp. vulgaris]
MIRCFFMLTVAVIFSLSTFFGRGQQAEAK